jgi:hypothetical protein
MIMVFVQLKFKTSLRDINISLNTMSSDFYHIGIKSAKKSSIAEALKKRNYQVYEDYYFFLLNSISGKVKRKFLRKVNLIDSTTISLCIQKYDWAKYRKTKGGIKLHTQIDYDTMLPEKIIITNAKVHDIKGVKNFDFNKDEYYIQDRGYVDYKYLYKITRKQAFFVTRIKKNALYCSVGKNVIQENTNIKADEIIKIEGSKKNDYPEKLRLVTFWHEESKKLLKFLTNNFDSTAEEISELYKARWQIELFFKWIKQHLKIKSFLSTNENGLKVQIWTALITYLMLYIIKSKIINCNIEILEILRKIESALDKRIELYELLSPEFIPKFQKKDIEKYLWEVKI